MLDWRAPRHDSFIETPMGATVVELATFQANADAHLFLLAGTKEGVLLIGIEDVNIRGWQELREHLRVVASAMSLIEVMDQANVFHKDNDCEAFVRLMCEAHEEDSDATGQLLPDDQSFHLIL